MSCLLFQLKFFITCSEPKKLPDYLRVPTLSFERVEKPEPENL